MSVGRWSAPDRREWRDLLAVIATMLCAASVAFAWGPETVVDPRSGDEVAAVLEVNEQGFALGFFRSEEGAVDGLFRLPKGAGDFLDGERPPVLRIEGQPAQQVFVSETGLTVVVFAAWNGEGEALTGPLRDLMEGQRVTVTYFLAGGGYKETSFSLAGADRSLAGAFGIPLRVTPEQRRLARELEETLLEAGQGCTRLKGKKRERCLEQVRGCRDVATTAAALRDCMANVTR